MYAIPSSLAAHIQWGGWFTWLWTPFGRKRVVWVKGGERIATKKILCPFQTPERGRTSGWLKTAQNHQKKIKDYVL